LGGVGTVFAGLEPGAPRGCRESQELCMVFPELEHFTIKGAVCFKKFAIIETFARGSEISKIRCTIKYPKRFFLYTYKNRY